MFAPPALYAMRIRAIDEASGSVKSNLGRPVGHRTTRQFTPGLINKARDGIAPNHCRVTNSGTMSKCFRSSVQRKPAIGQFQIVRQIVIGFAKRGIRIEDVKGFAQESNCGRCR